MTTEIQKQGGWGSGDTSYDEFVKRERVPMIRFESSAGAVASQRGPRRVH